MVLVVVLYLLDLEPDREEGVFVAVVLCLCGLEPDREEAVFVALPPVVVDIRGQNVLRSEA
jgi:hypothetical protein